MPTTSEKACWETIAGIVGSENLTFDTEFLRQSGWEGDLPQAAVFAGSREQVCEILRLAHSERLRVAPAGSCTKQRLGGVPRQIDLLLSLRRLHRITDYPAADLTISVEAGLPIRELNAALRGQGQTLPLDVPFAEEATIGGALASNATGSRRLAYGSWRDVVIGMSFVTADGKLAKSGGKVVKNVAGYDLAKMLIGSFGTLGIITDVTFKVFPLPPSSATFLLGFATAAQALAARNRILNSPLNPQALDLLDSPAGQLCGMAELCGAPHSLVVGAAGPEAVLERFRRELPVLVRGNGCGVSVCMIGEPERHLWKGIRDITPKFVRTEQEGAVVKASVVLSQTGAILEHANRCASEQGLALATLSRAGTGIVYCYFRPQPDTDRASGIERIVNACQVLLIETDRLGGRAVVEWCPAAVKEKIDIWGPRKDDFPLMQRLKAQFDPLGILNPGRFYGNI